MSAIPPIANLLAFEAAARRPSFALAAAELHLTASAISHMVARLEAYLAVRLFERRVPLIQSNVSIVQWSDWFSAHTKSARPITSDCASIGRRCRSTRPRKDWGSLWRAQ